ncbi:uncharacterized protein LOC112169057 isoform X1 [Rosa chinensis]|uniref:uncharacterized protein LOC112169057 isoform X1 n=1 Tax=Rosa chinensis TaxID=74649 RepID=UPI000D089315|nr:uncharacterized protein LOC112169057 isoform X1 [Rosa chinensis]
MDLETAINLAMELKMGRNYILIQKGFQSLQLRFLHTNWTGLYALLLPITWLSKRFGKACHSDMASETELRQGLWRQSSDIFIGTLPGMVIGSLPGMVIWSLPGMVIWSLPGMVFLFFCFYFGMASLRGL